MGHSEEVMQLELPPLRAAPTEQHKALRRDEGTLLRSAIVSPRYDFNTMTRWERDAYLGDRDDRRPVTWAQGYSFKRPPVRGYMLEQIRPRTMLGPAPIPPKLAALISPRGRQPLDRDAAIRQASKDHKLLTGPLLDRLDSYDPLFYQRLETLDNARFEAAW